MEKMHELREMLCEELDKITKKGELSTGSLDVVDKLTHSIKSIDTILAMEGSGYSGEYVNRSYARRRDAMGRYSRRGYSRDGEELVSELRELMEDAPDEKTKHEFRRFISKIESM